MDKIKELFENNPSKDAVYQTSDGYFFWEHSRAQSHAATLENRKIAQFDREGAKGETIVETEVINETTTEVETKETKEVIEPSKYETMGFAELKTEAKERGIVVEGSQSKANFIAALKAADANNKTQA